LGFSRHVRCYPERRHLLALQNLSAGPTADIVAVLPRTRYSPSSSASSLLATVRHSTRIGPPTKLHDLPSPRSTRLPVNQRHQSTTRLSNWRSDACRGTHNNYYPRGQSQIAPANVASNALRNPRRTLLARGRQSYAPIAGFSLAMPPMAVLATPFSSPFADHGAIH
jgi:hypothetical protein